MVEPLAACTFLSFCYRVTHCSDQGLHYECTWFKSRTGIVLFFQANVAVLSTFKQEHSPKISGDFTSFITTSQGYRGCITSAADTVLVIAVCVSDKQALLFLLWATLVTNLKSQAG